MCGTPLKSNECALMQSRKVNLFHEHVLVKEPGTEEPTPWHNDQPYWTVEGWQVASLWIPLDPVARENGVEYVAGSHRKGEWFKPKRFADSADHPSDDPRFLPVRSEEHTSELQSPCNLRMPSSA